MPFNDKLAPQRNSPRVPRHRRRRRPTRQPQPAVPFVPSPPHSPRSPLISRHHGRASLQRISNLGRQQLHTIHPSVIRLPSLENQALTTSRLRTIQLIPSNPTAAANGNASATRNDPVCVDTTPIIHGSAAAPSPETASTIPACRAVGLSSMSSAKVAGKNGARLNPSSTEKPAIVTEECAVANATVKTDASTKLPRCAVFSPTRSITAEAPRRPKVSAIQSRSVVYSLTASVLSPYRNAKVVSQPLRHVSNPP